jgi:hypothetical protein
MYLKEVIFILKISVTAQKMITIIGMMFILFIIIGFLLSISIFPFTIGLILGSSLSIYKVISIERNLEKSFSMDNLSATNYIRIRYLLRYLLTAVFIILSILIPWINFIGVMLGTSFFTISGYLTQNKFLSWLLNKFIKIRR